MAYMRPVPLLLTCVLLLSGGPALVDPERRDPGAPALAPPPQGMRLLPTGGLGTTSCPSQDLMARTCAMLTVRRLNGSADHGEFVQNMSPVVVGNGLMTSFTWTFTNYSTQHGFSEPVRINDNNVQSRKHACAR
jgi:hypothetical protein